MAAASVLTREKDFEDLLGTGYTFRSRPDPYTELADDLAFPRTNYSLEEIKEYALRAQQRRRFWEDLGHAASAAGVPLHAYAYAQGAHRQAPDTSDLVNPFHDEGALAEGLRREAEQQQRNAAHETRMVTTGTLWQEGHGEPTMMEETFRGPAEIVGENLGRVSGLIANRAGSGYRSDTSDGLATSAGAAMGRSAGRVVDTVLGAVGHGVATALGIEYDYHPPKGIPQKIQQRPPRGGNRGRRIHDES